MKATDSKNTDAGAADTGRAEGLVERLVPVAAALFAPDRAGAAPPLPGSAAALLAWAAALAHDSTLLWIAESTRALELAHRDLLTLSPYGDDEDRLLYYPAWESVPGDDAQADPDITGQRLAVLAALDAAPSGPRIVATCVQALMQRTIPRATIRDAVLTLHPGDTVDRDAFLKRLEAAGYVFAHEVVQRGEVAVRGGLVDLWPLSADWPVRMDFFGPELESLRTFDPANQRTRGVLDSILIPPASEWKTIRSADGVANARAAPDASLPAYLPHAPLVVWNDEDAIRDHAEMFEEAAGESGAGGFTIGMNDVSVYLAETLAARELRLMPATMTTTEGDEPIADMLPLPSAFDLPAEPLQPDIMEGMRQRFLDEALARRAEGWTVALYFDTPGAREHYLNAAAQAGTPPLPSRLGALSEGFVSKSLRLLVAAEPDLYGRRKVLGRRYSPRRGPVAPDAIGERISSLTDIEPGDLVVHIEHGLGRYLGLNEIVFDGQRQEVLTIEYTDNAKLHVPASHAHLLSRYVGVAGHALRLHRLGGRRWQREKSAAERSIMDLASSLLETQAEREMQRGYAFPPDAPWQHEFEAAFPYQETPDQHRVIAEVKRDMQKTRPMDRLVCGDAGYGKTEVAMRAAFKAVLDGKQVAVLVPTTVLAQQHFETFSERMAAYPVRIETLSRFRTKGTQHGVLKAMADGSVDIVIGTHALLQPSVAFKDLGLVVIDEEQRFGVAHKERLKQLRRLVDVLTMTATPIPRTMYMSLTGARDMSLLQTPPRERVPISTIVARAGDKVVRDAILREINRGGQVYYLHNRVMTIDWVRERLETLVPEASIRVAHGQMASRELSAIMHDFAAGRFDVLLCTTIVESGVDIPRANTILIDRADRFGIADLYQLRGRVGRSNHKAYAYLLTPTGGRMDGDARKRIGAIRKFSGLSAGFNLALRDLEIRGAGNLLGAEQSGHITAIGFGLYCQLLSRTLAILKGEAPPPIVEVDVRLDFITLSPGAEELDRAAMIPYAYIEDEKLRVAAYRKIAEAVEPETLDAIRSELADRFGDVPPPVGRLLKLARLRMDAARYGFRRVEVRGDKLMLRDDEDYVTANARFPRLESASADARLEEILRLMRDLGRR